MFKTVVGAVTPVPTSASFNDLDEPGVSMVGTRGAMDYVVYVGERGVANDPPGQVVSVVAPLSASKS
jgi:hypothetical protein